ncbi:MAG: hypothetical protein ACYCZO_13165, partial [Daejeonella sp.]
MLHEFSDKLYLQLDEELEFIEQNEQELPKRVNASVEKIRSALQTLKIYLEKHPFTNVQEEIQFFKHIKPKFYKRLIYLIKLYKL